MTEFQKIEKNILKISDRISNFDQNLSKKEKVDIINEELFRFTLILKYCLSDDSMTKKDYNDIMDKVEFETNRLFEICDLSKEDLKKYNQENKQC
jgi:hypothetical protein